MSSKKTTGFLVLALAVFFLSACGTESGLKNEKKSTAEEGETEKTRYREDSRLYQVTGKHEFTEEELEDLQYKLQKRVEGYSTEGRVILHGKRNEKPVIEIYIPKVSMSDEDYQEIISESKLEFISEYETENQRAWIENKHIEDAQPVQTENSTTGKEYAVALTLNEQGTKLFAQATSEMIGKTISIVYDGNVISTPAVQTVVTDGKVQITGLESWEQCEELATLFRVSKLEIRLKEIPNPNN